MPVKLKGVSLASLKGSIFVSYSHKDIDQVREIRNYLESMGIEPIMLYLRCMDDAKFLDRYHLSRLIIREIRARDWFLYIDSPNARASKWVQSELKYAMMAKDKHVIILNLEEGLSAIRKKLTAITRSMRVYMTFFVDSVTEYNLMRDEFFRQDFYVIDRNETFKKEEYTHLDERDMMNVSLVLKNGIFVPLITRRNLVRDALYNQMEYAYSHPDTIVFPVVDKASWNTIVNAVPVDENDDSIENYVKKRYYKLKLLLENKKVFLVNGYSEKTVADVVKRIRTALVQRINA